MVAEFLHYETLKMGHCIRRWPLVYAKGVLVGLLLLAVCAYGLGDIIDSRLGPPLLLNQTVTPATAVAREDGVLVMRVNTAPGRLCSAQVSRYIWRWETNPKGDRERNYFPIYSPPVPISDPAKEAHFRVTLEVPKGVSPGQYYYTSRLSTWCGIWGILFGDDTTLATPDVPVTIVPKS